MKFILFRNLKLTQLCPFKIKYLGIYIILIPWNILITKNYQFISKIFHRIKSLLLTVIFITRNKTLDDFKHSQKSNYNNVITIINIHIYIRTNNLNFYHFRHMFIFLLACLNDGINSKKRATHRHVYNLLL